MKTFKAGDKVRIVKCTSAYWWYAEKIGDVYTLLKTLGDSSTKWQVEGIDYSFWVEVKDIELVENEPSELTTFLKTQPWFIRTETPEKSEAAQKWLLENGLVWNSGWTTTLLSSGCSGMSGLSNGRFWFDTHQPYGTKEITLEFETVVKSFKLPEVKTQQEKLIEELEETIKRAQEKIDWLKNK